MSSAAEGIEVKVAVCANCGIVEIDDIKLEECTDCDLVRYCRDKCREEHREQHEEECNKRKKELHDKKLLKQPDGNHLGECPICLLPLSLLPGKSTSCSGCCKLVCIGCSYADYMSSGRSRCPFCREPAIDGKEENNKRAMKRVEVNDPNALRFVGIECYKEGDYDKVFEYWTNAVKLGDVRSHYHLGYMYYEGEGVEKEEEKGISHYEKAAIGGHPVARHNLAYHEGKNGNIERAVKHLIINARLGDEDSMKGLWKFYSLGYITKKDLDVTLRGHQAAINATKSEQREAAAEAAKPLYDGS